MKKVIITGATGGIGRSLATNFYEAGYYVILTGRNKSKLLEMKSKLGKNCDLYQCDLNDKISISNFCDEIDINHKSIDILVNNAGVTLDSLFIRMDSEKWERVIDLNLNSNFLLTSFFIKNMLKNRWGRVINITSVVCHTGNPGQANYCASKAGIIAMSKSIALEVAKRGITVNCISPGFIETSMTEKLSDLQKESIIKGIPMSKVGHPDDVANCALFLASEKSNYITGQTLHVNGGITMI